MLRQGGKKAGEGKMKRGGVIWLLIVVAAVWAAGCAHLSPRVAAIQRIAVGDTMAEVRRKAGPPDQVLEKQLIRGGQWREVWLYDVIVRSKPSFLGIIGPSPEDALAIEREYQLKQAKDPPYLVVFIRGKVAEITRQY